MKKLFYLFSIIFILLSCQDNLKYIGYESVQGKLSYKKETPVGRGFMKYTLYIQTPTSTRSVEVTSDEFENYKVGDPILLIVEKYQIPCKK